VQVPPAISVAWFPDTVQMLGVDDANDTGKPELAVAVRAKGIPAVCAAIAPKVIV